MQTKTHLHVVIAIAVACLPLAVPAYAAPSDMLPTMQEARKVCEYVAGQSLGRVDDAYLRTGYLDINNDGRPERVGYGWAGTTASDVFAFFSEDGAEIEVESVDFEWKDYMAHGQALLPFGKRIYFVHFQEEDLRYPVYVSCITPENKQYIICEFSNDVKEVIGGPPRNQEFCASFLTKQLPAVVFKEQHRLTYQAIQAAGRWETGIEQAGRVDFDNDGVPDQLILLQYSSGAGRGCDYYYYDILADGASIGVGPLHDLLMQMQDIDLRRRHPVPHCVGNEARWLVIDNVSYLETKYRGAMPEKTSEQFHHVKYVKDGIVNTACIYNFEVEPRVARYVAVSKE